METDLQSSNDLNSSKFYAELAPVIHNAEKKAAESKQDIESFVKIAKSTLWRWSNGLNKELPGPYKLFALLRYESGKTGVPEVASYYGGTIEAYLKKYFPSEFIAKKALLDLDPANEPKLADYISYIIFNMCGTGRKITLDEVKKTVGIISLKNSIIPKEDWDNDLIMAHGKSAVRRVNEMIHVGYLKMEGNFVIRIKENLHLNPVEKIDHISKNISTFFQIENVEKEINGLHFFNSCVTLEYAKKLARDIKEFQALKRDEASTNSDPNGIPITTVFFMDSLLFDSFNEDSRGTLQ